MKFHQTFYDYKKNYELKNNQVIQDAKLVSIICSEKIEQIKKEMLKLDYVTINKSLVYGKVDGMVIVSSSSEDLNKLVEEVLLDIERFKWRGKCKVYGIGVSPLEDLVNDQFIFMSELFVVWGTHRGDNED